MIHMFVSLSRRRGRVPSSHPTSQSRIFSRSLHTDWSTNKGFFHYTRGRFVSNKAHKLAIRRVEFDMNALTKIAAESVGSSLAQCVHVKKSPDGMFNKSFLFTMQDGSQVVGKVPDPNAGRAHYTTASEVATMDFVESLVPASYFYVSALICHFRSETICLRIS